MANREDISLSFTGILLSIVRRRVQVLLAIAVVTLLFGSQVPKLHIKTSIYDLVIEDLPETDR